MKRNLLLTILLVLFWLALSGHYGPFTLTLEVISIAVVIWLNVRMQIQDEQTLPPALLLRLPRYWVWLLIEIIKSNFHVAWKIWQPRLDIQPQFKRVPSAWRSNMTRVIQANSITLTPGTVSVQLEDDQILVHGLTHETITAISSDDMRQQLQRLDDDS